MSTINKYFWSLNEKAVKETVKILKDPKHPKFIPRMFALLSRCDKPKELFRLISRKEFIEFWPVIRRYWAKNKEAQDFKSWWEVIFQELNKSNIVPKGKAMKEIEKIGQLIKKARIKRGWSQSDFSKMTGIKQPNLSKIEKGQKNITLFTLIKICRILGIKEFSI